MGFEPTRRIYARPIKSRVDQPIVQHVLHEAWCGRPSEARTRGLPIRLDLGDLHSTEAWPLDPKSDALTN